MIPHKLGIVEAAKAIREKRLSMLDLAMSCIDHIAKREHEVHAWEFLDISNILAQVESLELAPDHLPLRGVPIAIKDIIATKGMPTCYGSPIYKNCNTGVDASCVAILRQAGAVIFGKTVTTEFAFFEPGKTRNPRNLLHTPGGSSSGSAAAVADEMVPGALGTQTAGSIIRPASFCGVVGYKPTYGDFNLTGIKGLAASLDTLGVLTRNVVDAALLRSVLLREPVSEPADLTLADAPSVALCRTPSWSQASPYVQAHLEQLVSTLEAHGAVTGEVVLPNSFSELAIAQEDLMAYEAARSLAHEYHDFPHLLSGSISDLIRKGMSVDRDVYLKARVLGELSRAYMKQVFDKWDILISPSAPGTAPFGTKATGDPIFSRMWMLLGLPTLSLPACTGLDGLPIGAQLVGAQCGDEVLLRSARWVEGIITGILG